MTKGTFAPCFISGTCSVAASFPTLPGIVTSVFPVHTTFSMTGATVVAVVFVDVDVTFLTGFATLAVLVTDFLTGFLVCP